MLKFTYVGYTNIEQQIIITGADKNIGLLKLSKNAKQLGTVTL